MKTINEKLHELLDFSDDIIVFDTAIEIGCNDSLCYAEPLQGRHFGNFSFSAIVPRTANVMSMTEMGGNGLRIHSYERSCIMARKPPFDVDRVDFRGSLGQGAKSLALLDWAARQFTEGYGVKTIT